MGRRSKASNNVDQGVWRKKESTIKSKRKVGVDFDRKKSKHRSTKMGKRKATVGIEGFEPKKRKKESTKKGNRRSMKMGESNDQGRMRTPMASEVPLEEGWEFIQGNVSKLKRIIDGSPEAFNAEEHMMLYTKIYNMCAQKLNNHKMELYHRLTDLWNDYVSHTVVPSLRGLHDEFLLREFVKRLANQKLMIRWMNRFFDYLDRYINAKRFRRVNEVGMYCFVELAFKTTQERATHAVLKMIERERDGEQIDGSLIKNVLDMFVEVGMEYYNEGFEPAMLEDTGNYYSRKAAIWTVEESLPDYLLKTEESLELEKKRVSHYMKSSSEEKVLTEVLNKLLSSDNGTTMLLAERSGCLALLKNDMVDDLSRMCSLFTKLKTSQLLQIAADIFKQHVNDEGKALVKQAEEAANAQNPAEKLREQTSLNQHNFASKLIDLHDKYLSYVRKNGCFGNCSLFHRAFNESFQDLCNKLSVCGLTAAELLAIFCDKILRKGGVDKLSNEVIDRTLDKVVGVLAYVSDKDLFGEFCRKKLAGRLLFHTSVNDEQEKSMLTKLKQHCGAQFTSKMESMVTDITLAKDMHSSFKNYRNKNPNLNIAGVDLNVTVLTTGCWPSYKSHDVNLPQELAKCVEVYKEFYQTDTKHRKLSWIYSLGTCIITGKFEKKPVELVVTTYQACLLMLFNSCDRLSYSEIVSQLNLEEDDVVRLLHSLSCGKYEILCKEPNSKMVSSTDVFEFNSMFTDKMRRIKIPLPPMEEKKKVVEEVNIDRKYTIDAAIVRIMKSRKVLEYQQLVTECVKQLTGKFKPDIKLIKKRIEDLITRDYLCRDDHNQSIFKYVA